MAFPLGRETPISYKMENLVYFARQGQHILEQDEQWLYKPIYSVKLSNKGGVGEHKGDFAWEEFVFHA